MTKTHTVYDAMPFADYTFQEYPKHLYPDGPMGPYVVVNDEDEELAALAEAESPAAREGRTKRAKASIQAIASDNDEG
jgi:hypothetical protein